MPRQQVMTRIALNIIKRASGKDGAGMARKFQLVVKMIFT